MAVSVGTPETIGRRGGRPVRSSIGKRPLDAGGEVRLDGVNLAGDDQADRRVHGGPEKALYAYPSEHLAAWAGELDLELGPASFGENLTTIGALEEDVVVGQVWRWGQAMVQACQPRSPCYKLALRLDRPQVLDSMIATGRTGWYLRVLVPGLVPVDGPLEPVECPAHAVTVLEAHAALFARHPGDDLLRRVAAVPELADRWHHQVARRLERGD